MNAILSNHNHVDVFGIEDFTKFLGGFATSLSVTRKVEQTCDELCALEKMAGALSSVSFTVAKRIRALDVVPGRLVDPDFEIADGIEQALRVLEDVLPSYPRARASIDLDSTLSMSHREMLHSSFDQVISTLSDLIEGTKEMVSALSSHDMDAEEAPAARFTTADALIQHLRCN